MFSSVWVKKKRLNESVGYLQILQLLHFHPSIQRNILFLYQLIKLMIIAKTLLSHFSNYCSSLVSFWRITVALNDQRGNWYPSSRWLAMKLNNVFAYIYFSCSFDYFVSKQQHISDMFLIKIYQDSFEFPPFCCTRLQHSSLIFLAFILLCVKLNTVCHRTAVNRLYKVITSRCLFLVSLELGAVGAYLILHFISCQFCAVTSVVWTTVYVLICHVKHSRRKRRSVTKWKA